LLFVVVVVVCRCYRYLCETHAAHPQLLLAKAVELFVDNLDPPELGDDGADSDWCVAAG
jgi:hypothetical protein